MIEQLTFHRFKSFRDVGFTLNPEGVTLLAGANNSGKSSLLHGLAVWEFCRTVIEQERGADALLASSNRKGVGMSDEEFSPVNIPSLRHLWTNLKSQRDGEPDGYTLKVRTQWTLGGQSRFLEIGLSLANDRLFLKATETAFRGLLIYRHSPGSPLAKLSSRSPCSDGWSERGLLERYYETCFLTCGTPIKKSVQN
jgi:AAA domain